ncbi:MAG: hypothetical protein HKN79_08040 [Flavobacteriales bacterium]|nr:hypothetical protein [Flavobacteriales bacterium]
MFLEQLEIHRGLADRLKDSVRTGRIPHTQYFQGVDGGGALQLAIAYAQEVLAGDPDMFGNVDDRASRLEHPDLHVVFPMVQSVSRTSEGSIQELRDALKEHPYLSYDLWTRSRGERNKKAIISKYEADAVSKKLGLRAFEGKHKVLLIWMAELMNPECSNKLLKLIEEPPQGSIIIMVGCDADKLLPTIRSRTQVIDVHTLSPAEILPTLARWSDCPDNELQEAAIRSEGNISLALELLVGEPDEVSEQVMDWLRLCYQRKVPETMDWSDSMAGTGREEVKRVLHRTAELFQAAFKKNFIRTEAEETDKEDVFTTRFSPFIHMENAEDLAELMDTAIRDIERHGNARVILLDVSFQLMRLLRTPRGEQQVSAEA